MATHVLPPDDELAITRFLRQRLGSTQWAGALVSNRLTERADGAEVPPAQDFAVIVRSDGGPALTPPTFLRRFGIRIFGPDGDDNGERTMTLARHVVACLPLAPFETVQVAAVRAIHGPYRVPPTVSRPEAYLTCELILVGEPITL